jgi:hypothetical protein
MSGRIVGLDVARCIALVGMMAVHILPSTRLAPGATEPVVDPLYLVFGGRSSALFAVLAGVALALVSGRATPLGGSDLAGARRSVAARAAIVLVIGLGLGVLDSGVAVILVNYALLFVAALPWLGCRWRTLAYWGIAWLVLTPVVSHVLRGLVPAGPGPVPSWLSLTDPLGFALNVLLTGYYPVLTWTGYLLVGLAVGRSPLLQRATSGWRPGLTLAALGAVTAVATKVISNLLLEAGGGTAHLEIPATSPVRRLPIDTVLVTSTYGTTPTNSWWWLATSGPHHGTPLDLLHGTGTALLVIGLCLVVAWAAGQSRWGTAALTPFAAAGAMTLTLYTGHVIALAATRASAPHDVDTWVTHVLVALALATLWRVVAEARHLSGRGPLEALSAMASAEAARASTPAH